MPVTLSGPAEVAVLVIPIDKEAPKGRLILPQVQTIRDLLDSDALCMMVKERELRMAFEKLKSPPKLVITDSQAFLKVAADTPAGVPMTSFSILFARFKGDLLTQVEGALEVEKLRAGDRVLIAEACTHHPIAEDIGRVKIPRWLTQYVGAKLQIDHVQGHDFPEDLSPYRLIIHCGACMWNRREMLSRILHCRQAGVADHQLRTRNRIQPGHHGTRAGAVPRCAGDLPQITPRGGQGTELDGERDSRE